MRRGKLKAGSWTIYNFNDADLIVPSRIRNGRYAKVDHEKIKEGELKSPVVISEGKLLANIREMLPVKEPAPLQSLLEKSNNREKTVRSKNFPLPFSHSELIKLLTFNL